MDVPSLSTPHYPFAGRHHPHPRPRPCPHPHPRPNPLSFSLKTSSEPDNNFRRPETLKRPFTTSTSTTSTSISTPKTLKNPLKRSPSSPSVPSPAPPQPQPPPKTSHSLSSKLWLSSKISPPPPEPPPPSPPPSPNPDTQILSDTQLSEDSSPEEVPPIDYRQLGKIFVGNLPSWIKKHEVAEFFRQFGPIKNVILIKGYNDTERNAGFGFVIYGGPTAATSAMKAVEFDGVEFHGRVLTVKLDDGRRQKAVAVERVRYVEGSDGREYRSKWHEERDGSRNAFRKVLDTVPENWQAVVTAFERIQKV